MAVRKLVALLAVLVLLGVVYTSALAATWTKVGTSGLTVTASLIQDANKPVISPIVFDDAGNAYCAVNNGNNSGVAGGITIFKTDGSKVDIDLNALGYCGGVTRMVKAGLPGSTAIYSLQAWAELGRIDWGNSFGEGLTRILRIDPDGTVTKILEGGWTNHGWNLVGAAAVILDFGDGNKGLQQINTTGAAKGWSRQIVDTDCTFAARFRVDSETITDTQKINILQMQAGSQTSPGVTVGIRKVGAEDHFVLTRFNTDADPFLVDLGLVDTGDTAWHEAYLYVNGVTRKVTLTWGGTVRFDDFVTTDLVNAFPMANNVFSIKGRVQAGCSTAEGPGGTSTVTFDWLAYGDKKIDPGTNLSRWTNYHDGSVLPHPSNDDRISDIAPGGDGMLYFIRAGVSNVWKYHHFWRYDPASGVIEEDPLTKDPNRYNNGNLEGECLIGLLPLGDLGPRNNSMLEIGNWGRFDWTLHSQEWGVAKMFGPYGSPPAGYDPGYGRNQLTAAALDPVRKNLWAGGWWKGDIRLNPAFREWTSASGADTKTSTVVDIEPGNKGIQIQKLDTKFDTWQTQYIDANKVFNWNPTGPATQNPALVTRFRVDDYSGNYDQPFIDVIPATTGTKKAAQPGLVIKQVDVGGTMEDHFVLQTNPVGTPPVVYVLADFGKVVKGEFHTLSIHAISSDVEGERIAKWKWDDQPWSSAVVAADGTGTGTGWMINIGACYHLAVTPPGTGMMTYDWFGIGRGDPESASFNYDYYFDGSKLPNQSSLRQTTVMSMWHGDQTVPTFFKYDTHLTEDPKDDTVSVASFAYFDANGNNPYKLDGKRDTGWYWVTGIDVNPYDGKAWLCWGTEANYNYGDLGHVVTRDVALGVGDEGVPEAGATVTGLKYKDGKMYATACNLTSGAYSLYETTVPNPGGPMSIGSMKRNLGALVSTDTPKIVTYPVVGASREYFYMEDADRKSGIKVLTAGIPDAALKGDKVTVSGFVDKVGGEAVIANATVTVVTSGNNDPDPLGVIGKAVGGGATGVQPATTPGIGLNTVGLLVKLAGIATLVTDDVVGIEWLAVDDGSGATVSYTNSVGPVIVPGIKVIYDDWPWTLTTGDKVSIIGVVSVESGKPILRARSAGDLTPY